MTKKKKKNWLILTVLLAINPAIRAEPIKIGGQLEPFMDNYLIAELHGARQVLHEPQEREIVLRFDQPWEGPFSAYCTVIKTPEKYQVYYRGISEPADGSSQEVTCYAESEDGINWSKPDLGLYEVAGTRHNNVILAKAAPFTHNFCPFYDTKPGIPADERYKAVAGTSVSNLYGFVSADGIHWKKIKNEPVFSRKGWVFDSQNVAFWSKVHQRYELYYREVPHRVRAVAHASSGDFLNWSEPAMMTYSNTGTDTPQNHLYTNQTHPYFRAPQIYIATAARFMPGRTVITEAQASAIHIHPKYFHDCSDSVFMTTRDGKHYDCTFQEALLKPGIGAANWTSRTNYPVYHIVPTSNTEMSLYYNLHYGQPTAHIRRYTFRLDGIASVSAGYNGGEMITKTLELTDPLPTTSENQRIGPVVFDTRHPIMGKRSLIFREPAVLTLPDTAKLGPQVTFAAHIRSIPPGLRRFFSTYDGGSSQPHELYFDFDSQGTVAGAAIRFAYDDVLVTVPRDKVPDFSDDAIHHLAATWDDGVVVIYFDGEAVAQGGSPGRGTLDFAQGDLHFGEDYPPTSLTNEPFLGQVDNILVLPRVLSVNEIKQLAQSGPEEILNVANERGILLTNETVAGSKLLDSLVADGRQDVNIPITPGISLLLNYATSAAGEIRVEIQDADGTPVPGFTLDECQPVIGNFISRSVTWKSNADLVDLVGQPIRLRFVLKDADLYSIRFSGLQNPFIPIPTKKAPG